MAKDLTINIPTYLTIKQYSDVLKYKGDSNFEKLVHTVSVLTGIDKETVQKFPIKTLTDIGNDYGELIDSKNEFHSILEWNGVLYGYSNIKNQTLGEYVDLENLSKDFENNMHKICALIYRPITKHRFNSLKFTVKQKIKMLNNDVENVFDWYEVEQYDNSKRKMVEESFKDFPAHIFLGAISFFLSASSLYSTNILYLERQLTKTQMETMMDDTLQILSKTIGSGGGLSTNYLNPIYLKLQGTNQ